MLAFTGYLSHETDVLGRQTVTHVLATPSGEKTLWGTMRHGCRLLLGLRNVGLGTGNKVQLNDSREFEASQYIITTACKIYIFFQL